MKSSKKTFHFWPTAFLLGVTIIFFSKTFLYGYIPFPGDLLISEYKPWSTYSFLGYNPGSYPSKKQYFDTIRQIYPWRTLVNDQIKKGQLPLWNPYNFSGAPLLANVQSQVFYPLTILYLVLNQKTAWTILILLQPLLSALFMYFYMRKINGSVEASLLAAIAYGFSLFMTVFLEYNTIGQVMIWLPFLFLMVELLKETKKPLPTIGFVFGVVSAGLAGHLQLFGSVLLFTLLYAVFRIISNQDTRHHKQKHIAFFTLLLLMAIGIASVQFIPTAELLFISARSNHNYADIINRLLIQPKQLFMAFSPDIFGNPATNNYLAGDSYPGKALGIGVLPLFFASYCLVHKKRDSLTVFFGSTIGFLLLTMVRNPISEILYRASLPFVSASAPTNNIFVLSFALAVLAGCGFDKWKEKKEISKNLIIGFVGVFFLAWALYATEQMAIVPKNLLFSTIVLIICVVLIKLFQIFKPARTILAYLMILVTIGELWYFFQKFNPFVPASLVFPETAIVTWLKQNAGTDRSWGYGTANIEANFTTQVGIYSPDGYDPLFPRYYGSFLAASKNGKLLTAFTDTTRSDAVITPGFGEADFADNLFRLKILNLLGVRYILNRPENNTTERTFPPEQFSEIFTDNGWTVIQNKNVLPRTFLTISTVLDPTLSLIPSTGSAQIRDYYPNYLQINTDSSSSALLFLSDTYFPGWKATVDGNSTPIMRAGYAFRAILVPRGNHVVTFSYSPESVKYGAIISGVSILILLATCRWLTIREGKRKNNEQNT